MKTRISVFTAAAFAFLLTGCVPIAAPTTVAPSSADAPPAPPTQSLVTPAEIVRVTVEHYNAGDLAEHDGLLGRRRDILHVRHATNRKRACRGQQSRLRLSSRKTSPTTPGGKSKLESIVGDVVNTRSKNWHDFTRQIGVAPLESSGVFVIQDAKITSYTWILNADSASNLKNALVRGHASRTRGRYAERTTGVGVDGDHLRRHLQLRRTTWLSGLATSR